MSEVDPVTSTASPAEPGEPERERRRHPRVEVPLLVELQHPTMAAKRCLVENISKSGIFVGLPSAGMRVGSEVKVKLLNSSAIEQEATPTVAMRVERCDDSGLGLTFSNSSARHLWQSAERRRCALNVGRDYFQVHINLVVMTQGRMLLLSQRGHWLLPHFYLRVGEDWQAQARSHLSDELGLADLQFEQLLTAQARQVPELPETAALSLYQLVLVPEARIALSRDADYSDHRWIKNARMLKELTLAAADIGMLETLF